MLSPAEAVDRIIGWVSWRGEDSRSRLERRSRRTNGSSISSSSPCIFGIRPAPVDRALRPPVGRMIRLDRAAPRATDDSPQMHFRFHDGLSRGRMKDRSDALASAPLRSVQSDRRSRVVGISMSWSRGHSVEARAPAPSRRGGRPAGREPDVMNCSRVGLARAAHPAGGGGGRLRPPPP
jgi:hypothetical protein